MKPRGKRRPAHPAVVRPKLSERVAGEIMAEIRSRGWPVGELLGTEAELMARFRVSRATMLEAIRQVERQGAVAMRRGVNGGLTVTAPAAATISRSLSTYLEFSDVSLAEQFEAWRIMEVYAVGQAAQTIAADGIAELRRLVPEIDAAEDNIEYLKRCMAVRIAIAERTSNPAIALFLRVLVRVLSRALRSDVGSMITQDARQIRVHLGEIVDAIAAGDVALARGIARINLGLREGRAQKVLHQRGEPGRRPLAGEPQKLAETIGRRICDDIAAMGWPEGVKLGDEPELLQRYDVSRWILRQALRTLEVHQIVRTKRGQGGGLMIGRPDPSRTIEAAAMYLSFTGYRLEDVSDVWAMLLENAVQMAGRNAAAEPGRLAAIVAAEEAAETPHDLRLAASAFYTEISRLCGNRVVALFLEILAEYLRAHELSKDRLWILEAMKSAHRQVADALATGDGGSARRHIADYSGLIRPYFRSGPASGEEDGPLARHIS